MKATTIALSLSVMALASACSSADNETDVTADKLTPAKRLVARLDSVVKSGSYAFGHADDPVYGHTWCGDKGRSDVLETAGDYPGVMNWDLGLIELDSLANLDGVKFDRMRTEAVAQDARGGINTFSWHSHNPAHPDKDSWWLGDSATVTKILTDSVVNNQFRTYAQRAARFLSSIKDAEGNAVPVVLRAWHEHTGSWFWWGKEFCTPDEYKQLWSLTREVFDAEGVDNVVWAYSPDRVHSEAEYMERYPGDDYVDVMGIDIYHFGTSNPDKGIPNYTADVTEGLDIVCKMAQSHGKVAAFTETGCESLPIANWWTDVLAPTIGDRKIAYVTVWRNAHDKPAHYYAPYPGQESEASFKAYCSTPRVLMAKDLEKIK